VSKDLSRLWGHRQISHAEFLLAQRARLGDNIPWLWPGFDLKLLHFDLMHDLYRGVGEDVLASSLLIMASAGAPTRAQVDVRLRKLWLLCKRWCKSKGLACFIEKFSRRQLLDPHLCRYFGGSLSLV
jgi:hypothetical protein